MQSNASGFSIVPGSGAAGIGVSAFLSSPAALSATLSRMEYRKNHAVQMMISYSILEQGSHWKNHTVQIMISYSIPEQGRHIRKYRYSTQQARHSSMNAS